MGGSPYVYYILRPPLNLPCALLALLYLRRPRFTMLRDLRPARKNTENYWKILKCGKMLKITEIYWKIWKKMKNTEMYCIFADQALQDYETCGLLEDERGCAVYKKSAWDGCSGNYRPARCNFSSRGLSKMQKVMRILYSTKTTTHRM